MTNKYLSLPLWYKAKVCGSCTHPFPAVDPQHFEILKLHATGKHYGRSLTADRKYLNMHFKLRYRMEAFVINSLQIVSHKIQTAVYE